MANERDNQGIGLGEALDAYLKRLEETGEAGRVALVAASPRSALAEAIWSRLSDLRRLNCDVAVVFGAQSLKTDGARLMAFVKLFGESQACRSLSFARFRGADTLLEQVVFGPVDCWSAGEFAQRSPASLQRLSSARAPCATAVDVAFASFSMARGMADDLRPSELARIAQPGADRQHSLLGGFSRAIAAGSLRRAA